MGTDVQLPTWGECHEPVMRGDPTALEAFIHDREPAGEDDDLSSAPGSKKSADRPSVGGRDIHHGRLLRMRSDLAIIGMICEGLARKLPPRFHAKYLI